MDFQEFDKIERVFTTWKIREVFRTRGDPGVAWTIEFGSAKIDRFSWECAPKIFHACFDIVRCRSTSFENEKRSLKSDDFERVDS